MSSHIKFDKETSNFTLYTKNTCYTMGILYGKHLIHYYYGDKRSKTYDYVLKYRSFSPYPQEFGDSYSADTAMHEYPFFGSGDFRPDALRIRNENGDCCTLFTYKSYKIFSGRKELKNLPYSLPYAEADENTQTLKITMEDELSGCVLDLYYTLFYECDIISRYCPVTTNSPSAVKIEKSMSLSLDIPSERDFDWFSLYGSYGVDRSIQRTRMMRGKQSIFLALIHI